MLDGSALKACRSVKLAAVRHGPTRADENHVTVLVWKSERQHLGQKGADLPRREIDDSSNLAADQIRRLIVARDLG